MTPITFLLWSSLIILWLGFWFCVLQITLIVTGANKRYEAMRQSYEEMQQRVEQKLKERRP